MDATSWDDRYRATDRLWSEGPNIFVEDRLRTSTPGRGVDLASGEGRNAIWLASLGWEMTAVDFSAVAVARGESQAASVSFACADVRTWEPDDEQDLVLIAYLQLVADDFYPLVERAAGWLRPGGELFMVGHDVSNIEEGYGGPQVPEILWDVDEILARLSGLTVIEAQVVRRPVALDGDFAYARDALVRARTRA